MNPLDENLNDERLTAYFDGELSPAESAAVERQLQSDPSRGQQLQDWQELRQSIRELPRSTAPAGMAQSILDRVAKLEPATIPQAGDSRPAAMVALLTLAALLLCTLFLSPLLVSNPATEITENKETAEPTQPANDEAAPDRPRELNKPALAARAGTDAELPMRPIMAPSLPLEQVLLLEFPSDLAAGDRQRMLDSALRALSIKSLPMAESDRQQETESTVAADTSVLFITATPWQLGQLLSRLNRSTEVTASAIAPASKQQPSDHSGLMEPIASTSQAVPAIRLGDSQEDLMEWFGEEGDSQPRQRFLLLLREATPAATND